MKKLSLLFSALACAGALAWADPIDSEYCGQVMSSGNTEAAFTWETNAEGEIIVTITETLGGAQDAAHFRGNGINIDKIKVGDGREEAANYFTLVCGGKQTITLTPIEGKTLVYGTKIYVENQIIEYTTSKDGNAWPTLTFIYTYGGVCNVEQVLSSMTFSAAANYAKPGVGIELQAAGYDQMGKPMEVVFAYEVNPADAGVVADGVYTPAKTGAATITASAGELSKELHLYGVAGDNIAVGLPCEAGYLDDNLSEQAGAANDGNDASAWVTYANQEPAVEWWFVDLGKKEDLVGIELLWGDAYSTHYIVQVRDEAPADADKANDEAWNTVAEVQSVTAYSATYSDLTGSAGRYVRIHSLAKSINFFRLREVRIFTLTDETGQGGEGGEGGEGQGGEGGEGEGGENQKVETANSPSVVTAKTLRNGMLYIRRGDKCYSVLGYPVKD